MKIRNPRTGEHDYTLVTDTVDQVMAKAGTLRAAHSQWLSKTLQERIEIIVQLADRMEAHKEAFIEQLSIDTGRRNISELEFHAAIGVIRGRCASAPYVLQAPKSRSSMTNPTVNIHQQWVPYDLVGVISPWNFPLLLCLIDAIPALIAGSTVLLKPSEVTPRFMDVLEQCIQEVPGLSEVTALVRGGAEVGKSVVDQVDVICFTGSVKTGQMIAKRTAELFKPAFLELGGKDPAIVMEDADLDVAIAAIMRSGFGAAGQACQSLERVYVHRTIYDDFIHKLTDKANAVTTNHDYSQGGNLGPLIFEGQRATIESQLADATAKGAQIKSGGTIENHHGGLWLRPTIVTEVNHDMEIMTEETFGPVIGVMPYDSTAEAISLANDSIYGLSASVFSQDTESAVAVAQQIDAGGISINDGSLTNQVFDAEKNSFGMSGLYGSRMGADGLLRFFRKKAILIQTAAPASLDTQAEKAQS